MNRKLREFCGVFGIYGDPHAAEKVYLGLYALQHRGQESAGIAASDGSLLSVHRGTGLVWSVFSNPSIMPRLAGSAAIGHNRYSTTGSTGLVNAQPLFIQCKIGQIAAAHNGNVSNAFELRRRMEEEGSIFQTTTDSEIVLHLISRSHAPSLEDKIAEALVHLDGAYCFVFLTKDRLIASRDPYGFRPLCLGRLGDALVVASESCALDIIGAAYERSIEPGEILSIGPEGVASRRMTPARRRACCIFEYIYFSRPDSIIFGEKVDKARRFLGKELAKEAPCDADIVIAVPDSASTAALGYAQESKIRFEIGLIRNHYVGRTFIAPHQDERDLDVRVKFNPVAGVLRGKRVVIVEDSIVRGTTLRQLVRLVRSAEPREIHVRVSSPPLVNPCFYGIDIPEKKNLIAASRSVEDIRRHIEADSLRYLSVEGMLRAVTEPEHQCTACFTGDYPTMISEDCKKDKFDFCRLGMA
ncbi:MAG: amidophosphoribosyltransferase [Deltaproteobacteria bacterium]|nr:amidophosphoribosyltransferase [Deltaproteobacteria bacterium]